MEPGQEVIPKQLSTLWISLWITCGQAVDKVWVSYQQGGGGRRRCNYYSSPPILQKTKIQKVTKLPKYQPFTIFGIFRQLLVELTNE